MSVINETLTNSDTSAEESFAVGNVSLSVRYKDPFPEGASGLVWLEKKPAGSPPAGHDAWEEITSWRYNDTKNPADRILVVGYESAVYRFRSNLGDPSATAWVVAGY